MSKNVKVVVYVPESQADLVRLAIGRAGAGKIVHYSSCSFSLKGVGRFKPEPGAKPTVGSVGQLSEVIEERIEVTCFRDILKDVLAAIKKVHPYEEVALDVYALEDLESF